MAVTPPPTSIPTSRYVVFAAIAAGGLALDLWSKWAVFAALGWPVRPDWDWKWQLGDFVRFTLLTNFNKGALWGLGQDYTALFAALSIAAVLGIHYFLFVAKYARSKWLTVALAFVTAGALGNLYDRLGLHGWKDNGQTVYAVRDFLDFHFFETFHWATFNVADSMLVTGAIMLVIHSLWLAPATQPGETAAHQPTPAV